MREREEEMDGERCGDWGKVKRESAREGINGGAL